MTKQLDVVIVGAGLAGLTAARQLAKAGLRIQLVEAADQIGGRVKTEVIDGFRLDHGFQLFNPAYPAARSVLNISELELKKFKKGVRVLQDQEIIELGRNLTDSIHFLRQFDKQELINFSKYLAITLFSNTDSLAKRANVSATQALVGAKIDGELYRSLLKPFLSGVFLNSDLTTSRIWLDEVLRYFVLGRPGLPKYGMQEIPNQLSRGITDFIQLNTKVTQVETNQVISSEKSWSAKYVVLATDPVTTAKLLGTTQPMVNSVSTHYFSIKHRNRGPSTKLLAIDGSASPGPAVNSVVLTDAAASYAPAGYDLVATSVIGTQTVDLAQVQSHTALLHTLNPADLSPIKSFEIPAALPQTDYVDKAKLKSFSSAGIYVASDLITTPSINGAISSGQKVADEILLSELKG